MNIVLLLCAIVACITDVTAFLPQKFSRQLALFENSDVLDHIHSSNLLPTTILSGFLGKYHLLTSSLIYKLYSLYLGAGKTTLLNNILKNNVEGKRFAIIVNDLADLNIDGKLIQPFVAEQREEMVQLSNGCICCTLREDLIREVTNLAMKGKFDHLIIESTGVSEPGPVADTFMFSLDDNGNGDQVNLFNQSLLNIARIESMITVVDAFNFLLQMNEVVDLSAVNMATGIDDTRTITDLLLAQIEFANIILLNKCDSVTAADRVRIKQYLRALNAQAEIIESVQSEVPTEALLGRQLFDYEATAAGAGWVAAMHRDKHRCTSASLLLLFMHDCSYHATIYLC